jgi:hypothetical protein
MNTEHYRVTVEPTCPAVIRTTEVFIWRAPGSSTIVERAKVSYHNGGCRWGKTTAYINEHPSDAPLTDWINEYYYCISIKQLNI